MEYFECADPTYWLVKAASLAPPPMKEPHIKISYTAYAWKIVCERDGETSVGKTTATNRPA